MNNPMKTRLAVRSSVTITAVMAALGVLIIAFTSQLVARQETTSHLRLLEGLLTTVEQTAAVAAFLNDSQLAREIVVGLEKTPTIAGSIIIADGQVLASQGLLASPEKASIDLPTIIRRSLASPFDADEIVGEIRLISNQKEIDAKVRANTRLATSLLLLLVVVIGLSVILVVAHMVTRPITRVSRRIHLLNVELGEKLKVPKANQHDEVGSLVRDVNAMIDHLATLLNSEKQLREEKEANERRYRTILENAQSAIFVCDVQGLILAYNPAFLRIFNLSPSLGDHSLPDLFQLVGDQAANVALKLRQCLDTNRGLTVEVSLADPLRHIELILHPGDTGTIQVIGNDITTFKNATSEAEQRASTDALTGLGNRHGFERRLAQLLRETPHNQPFALIFLDLDHFKEVNDTHGHQAGDTVLIRVADILRSLTRRSDYIARLGGDEFIVLLEGVDREPVCIRLAEELLAVLGQPLVLDASSKVNIGVSIGIAFGETGTVDAATIVSNADKAMYRAKQEGRHRYFIHRQD